MGQIVDISQALLELGVANATADERAVIDRAITGAEGAIIRHLGYDPAQRSRTEIYPGGEMLRRYWGTGMWDSNQSGTQAIFWSRNRIFSDLQVQHLPIRSVTNLWVNVDGRATSARFTSDHLKTAASASEGGDYWVNFELEDSAGASVCRDGLIRSHGLWPLEPGSVKIQYTAGYDSDELQGVDTILNARPIVDAILNETVRRAKKVFLNRKQTAAGWVPGAISSERLGDYQYTIGGTANAVDSNFAGAADLLPETIQMLADFVNWGWRLQG